MMWYMPNIFFSYCHISLNVKKDLTLFKQFEVKEKNYGVTIPKPLEVFSWFYSKKSFNCLSVLFNLAKQYYLF